MRILHIIQRYHPAVGGAEIYMREISEHLAAGGHQVTVLTTDALDFELFWIPDRRRIAEREGQHEGVRILRFPVRHLPGCPLMYSAWRRLLWLLSSVRPIPASWLAWLARYTPWVPDLYRWLETTQEPFDLVAAMTICYEPLLEAGLRFAQRRGIPFVAYPLTHLGAGAAPASDALSRFYTMRHQVAVVRGSDAVITATPAEKAFYEQRGVPGERIVVAGPGIEPAAVLGGDGGRFRDAQEIHAPLVVSIAPMSYDKGTMHLVEAVLRLRQGGCAVELALAGPILAPFRRYLAQMKEGAPHGATTNGCAFARSSAVRRYLAARGHERAPRGATTNKDEASPLVVPPSGGLSWLHILGPVSEETKRDLLAAADLFAMPSRTDSFGIVYLEAWLYGVPVIGARVWGVCDVIHDGEDGLLVPFGDVPALAAAIERLLDSPQTREEMGARGRRRVYAEYMWSQRHALISLLYANLVTGRG
jgi:glycogen(starch) synthase